MDDENPVQILKKWINGLKNKKSNKTLLLYGSNGVGKTYFVENMLGKKFNLKLLTNDMINELKDEKPANYYSFLSLFFEMISFKDTNPNPRVMVINENKLYNFDKCEQIVNKLIDDNVKFGNKYPIIVVMDKSKTKFINDIKKKSTSIMFDDPDEDNIKVIINKILAENKFIDKINPNNKSGKASMTLIKKMTECSGKNLNKLFVLMNNLMNNYCDDNVITKTNLSEFLEDLVDNNDKNNIYVSNYELLTSYKSVNHALNIFNHDAIYNPLVMEESYKQKIVAYERFNGSIWNSEYREIVKRLTKSFAYSNLYDTFIFNTQQWNLKRIYGYFSCALPSFLLSKIDINYSPSVDFPVDFNKTSIQRINTKQIFNIYEKLDIINIEYYIYIGEYIKNIIDNCINKKETDKDKTYWLRVKRINEFMDYCGIDINMLERIIKINKLEKQIKFTKALDTIIIKK